MTIYRSKPLDLNSADFRLLRLWPGQDSPIHCGLFTANHEDAGRIPYEALSYTRRVESGTDTILVDGTKFNVPTNLYLALRNLRLPYETRILWIDAICIDQNNPQEHSHQVRRMGSIYRRAKRVLFWLDVSSYETNTVMDALKSLEDRTDREALYWDWEIIGQHWRDEWSDVQLSIRAALPHQIAKQREGLHQLLASTWFSRLWILQEVANAQEAIVCAGTRTVSSSVFAIAPLLMKVRPTSQCQAVLDIMPSPLRAQSWWSHNRDLFTLLTKFNTSQATDKRDKIFALLGISSDAHSSPLLSIEYTKSVPDVYNDLAKYLLKSTKAPLPDILSLFAGFKDIRTVYLIHGQRAPIPEINQVAIYKSYPRDPKTFFIEENSVSSNPSRATLFQCVKRARHEAGAWPKASGNKKEPAGFWVEGWDYPSPNVEMLVVRDFIAALERAASEGYCRIVEMILGWGIDPNVKCVNNSNALQAAVFAGQKYVVELLLSHGAKINAHDDEFKITKFEGTETIMKLLISTGMEYALQEASCRGYVETIKLLLAQGHDVNDPGGLYGSPLQAAVYKGHLKVVETLVKAGADINIRKGCYGSPVQIAATFGYRPKILKALMANGADIHDRTEIAGDALQAASYAGNIEFVQELISMGVDINAQCGALGCALSAACYSGHSHVVSLLLEHGAKIDTDSGYYGSAIQAAAAGNQRNVIQLLLRNGADVNATGGHYGSALQAAVSKRGNVSIKVIELLLENGAATGAPAGHNGNAIQIMASKGANNNPVTMLLQEYGALMEPSDTEAVGSHRRNDDPRVCSLCRSNLNK